MTAKHEPGQGATGLRSPFGGWIGGKYRLSGRIIPLIPAHKIYVEPFAGAGWVYFRKRPSPCEIINDINSDLINMWRVVRDSPGYLLKRLETELSSRQVFEEYRDMAEEEVAAMPEEERAWRLLYLLRMCFGGRDIMFHTLDEMGRPGHRRSSWCAGGGERNAGRYQPGEPRSDYAAPLGGKHVIVNLAPLILPAAKRLAETEIENLPWQRILGAYDKPETFFYLDPPYIGCEEYYGSRFTGSDFRELGERLAGLAGCFILSLNDHPLAHEVFAPFRFYQVETSYSLASKSIKRVKELLISNYSFTETAMLKNNVAPYADNNPL